MDRKSECRGAQGSARATDGQEVRSGLPFRRIAPAHGPGQPLDRYAVSPSPCAPRCTSIPSAHRSRRWTGSPSAAKHREVRERPSMPPAMYVHPFRASLPASMPPAMYVHPWTQKKPRVRRGFLYSIRRGVITSCHPCRPYHPCHHPCPAYRHRQIPPSVLLPPWLPW